MKPHYRYFWDRGQCGLYLGAIDGVPLYSFPDDPVYTINTDIVRIQAAPSHGYFFAYEERPRLH